MTLGRTLLYGRQMVLPVFTVHTLVSTGGVEFAYSPAIQKELAALQVAFLTCQLVKSHQRHLHHSMSRSHAYPVSVEYTQHIIGSLACAVQQFVFTCSQIIGNTSLNEFSYVECLMGQIPVHLPFLSVVPGMQRVMDGEVSLQVAVRFLSRADKVHHTVTISLQFRVFLSGQHVRGPF